MNNTKKILLKNIESIPSLIKDFLNDEAYSSHRFSLDNALKQAEIKKQQFSDEQRKILHHSIYKQMQHLELTEKQKENLNALKQNNVFTVTTGHQLNLFSGSGFFIYKILQTIKTADYLNQHSKDAKFVPIFWLATEDHDFEEINHFKTQNNIYQITGKSGGPVGRIKIEENHFIKEFEREFKDDVYGTELILWLKEAYKIGNTLTEATQILVNRLFGEKGLLMIDGDDKDLKAQMENIFSDELKNQSLKNTTETEIQKLTQKYGKVQVNPRDINLFYLSETRNRIEREGSMLNIVDTNLKFSQKEILQNIENISPNALMRPIYQESILPNIAYIGGNAEIMYWLELKNYFKTIPIAFPILIPRNSMLFLPKKTFDKIEKIGLEIEDFFKNYTEVTRNKLLHNTELEKIIEDKEEELKQTFEYLKEKSSLTDKTFRNLVEAEETRQMKSYARMKKRLLRAEKIRQHERYSRMNLLYLEVHPNNIWQERFLNFSVFYAQNGAQWIKKCYDEMDVENSTLIISCI